MSYVITDGCDNLKTTPAGAVLFAKSEAVFEHRNWYRYCDKFVATCYGFEGSGYNTASEHWRSIPLVMKGIPSITPPAGSILYWNLKSDTAGHVAIAVDSIGTVASVDILETGRVDLVPFRYITSKWGAEYAGWARPYMPKAWGTNPYPTKSTSGTFPLLPGHAFGYDPDGKKLYVHGGLEGSTADKYHIRRIQALLGSLQTGVVNYTDGVKIRLYQTKNLLTPDGLVGPKTWNKMFPPSYV